MRHTHTSAMELPATFVQGSVDQLVVLLETGSLAVLQYHHYFDRYGPCLCSRWPLAVFCNLFSSASCLMRSIPGFFSEQHLQKSASCSCSFAPATAFYRCTVVWMFAGLLLSRSFHLHMVSCILYAAAEG